MLFYFLKSMFTRQGFCTIEGLIVTSFNPIVWPHVDPLCLLITHFQPLNISIHPISTKYKSMSSMSQYENVDVYPSMFYTIDWFECDAQKHFRLILIICAYQCNFMDF